MAITLRHWIRKTTAGAGFLAATFALSSSLLASTQTAETIECGATHSPHHLGQLIKEMRFDNSPETPGLRRLITEQTIVVSGTRRYDLLQEIPSIQDDMLLEFSQLVGTEANPIQVTVCAVDESGNATGLETFRLNRDSPFRLQKRYTGLQDQRLSVRIQGTRPRQQSHWRLDLKLKANEGQPWQPKDKQTLQQPVTGFADLHLHQTGAMAFNEGWYWGSHMPGPLEERLPHCDGKHASFHEFDFLVKFGPTRNLIYGITSPGNIEDFIGTHEDRTEPEHYVRSDDRKHQQVAFERLRQAHERGVKLVVSTTVENFILSYLMKTANKGRDDWSVMSMESIKRQIRSLHQIDRQVDWFEIVLDPWHARRAINEGKLAVVIGAEFSNIFPSSDGPWKQQLWDLYEMGLRHLQPVHKVDSRFHSTHDQGFPFDQVNILHALASTDIPDLPAKERFVDGKSEPSQGITRDGRALLKELTRLNMIVDLSHSSEVAQQEATDFLVNEANYYPIFYSHWAAKETELLDALKRTGGMVAFGWSQPVPEAHAETAAIGRPVEGVCEGHLNGLYKTYRDFVDYGIKFSLGSDFNGFTSVTGPNFGPKNCQLTDQQKDREDQVATYERLREIYPNHPDWVARYWAQGTADISLLPGIVYDLQHTLGLDISPIENSVEDFLQMWERTYDTDRDPVL